MFNLTGTSILAPGMGPVYTQSPSLQSVSVLAFPWRPAANHLTEEMLTVSAPSRKSFNRELSASLRRISG
jgi:hypothetical protein